MEIYVNNILLLDLGVVLAPDSLKSLLQWSPLKSVAYNDWAEEDYIEPDLESPVLDKRTVTLNFHAQGLDGYEQFMEFLTVNSLTTWNFTDLGVTLNLRVENNNVKSVTRKWQSFSVVFVDDAPYAPNFTLHEKTNLGGGGFTIDDYDFADFGVWILAGTLDKIRPIGKVKERLIINEQTQQGAVYDYQAEPTFQNNDITIKCLIRAETAAECINNYFALLKYLIRPNSRYIYVSSTTENITCYYKSSTCNAVAQFATGLFGIAFDINFVVINREVLFVLSSDREDNVALTDEDGKYIVLEI